MTASRPPRPPRSGLARLVAALRGQALALSALVLALSGTAWAAGTIGSPEVINESLRSVDLRNDELRGSDFRDDRLAGGGLDEVDFATDSVGPDEIDLSTLALVRTPCGAGTVGGYARVEPDALTTGYEPLADSASCGGGQALARRLPFVNGIFRVCFPATELEAAVASSLVDAAEDATNHVSVRAISESACEGTALEAHVIGGENATRQEGNFALAAFPAPGTGDR